MTDPPHLFIVGGPNGSGKTTVAMEYSEALGLPYLGADQIAASLSSADYVSVGFEAGRRFIHRVNEIIATKTSQVIESTLSGTTFRKSLVKARQEGFLITVACVFVGSADVCVERVAKRVRKGGHNVPEADIRRRYYRSLTIFGTSIKSWPIIGYCCTMVMTTSKKSQPGQ